MSNILKFQPQEVTDMDSTVLFVLPPSPPPLCFKTNLMSIPLLITGICSRYGYDQPEQYRIPFHCHAVKVMV